jgi:hypothetical protein
MLLPLILKDVAKVKENILLWATFRNGMLKLLLSLLMHILASENICFGGGVWVRLLLFYTLLSFNVTLIKYWHWFWIVHLQIYGN